jgi:Transcriptional regulator, AbiEi antitoxin, Type IV TA system/Transcriptional regulator, AbiEi antitoxin N-terminal domain
MNHSNSSDLLGELLPANSVATRPWLLANGLSKDRLDNYVKSGRLRKLARGVYCHRYALLSWQSVMASFGKTVPQPAYVGGLSSLHESGYTQYLNLSKVRTVDIFSPVPEPHWLKEVAAHLDSVSFTWHKTHRLWPQFSQSHPLPDQTGFMRASENDPLLASQERAFIELLNEVPKRISFEHADEIMQGLVNLSPRKLERLLDGCNSVKAKRLFCWFAERHQHSWWKKLDYRQFDLGAGKRVVQEGGRLDSRYQITVPDHMYQTYSSQIEAAQ